MNKDTYRIQAVLPGFEFKYYCLEKALECDGHRPAANTLIVQITLVAITFAANDGNGTEVSINGRKNIRGYFRRHFHPMEGKSKIKMLQFLIHFRGDETRQVTLYANRMIAASDEFVASFEQHLEMMEVIHAEDPE